MNKLKQRWNISSNTQLFLILLGFAITGYSSLLLAKPFMAFLGLTDEIMPHWVYRVLRIILIFPIYQILLVFVGFLLGQFSFFWNFEKKMLHRMKLDFIADFVDNKIKKGA